MIRSDSPPSRLLGSAHTLNFDLVSSLGSLRRDELGLIDLDLQPPRHGLRWQSDLPRHGAATAGAPTPLFGPKASDLTHGLDVWSLVVLWCLGFGVYSALIHLDPP